METMNREAATCFPFLQLPREIRNQIYSILLESEDVPLQLSELIAKRHQANEVATEHILLSQANDERSRAILLYNPAQYQAHNPATLPERGSVAFLRLRLASHQVLAEVSDAVRVYNPRGGTYKLDVILCGGCCLSWTALPTPLQELRHVIVDLHIFSFDDWSGDRGPRQYLPELLRLLTTFLRTGPSFSENQSVLPDVKLDSITVNVADYEGSESFEQGAYRISQRLGVLLDMVALSRVLFRRVWLLKLHAKNKKDE
ncbi:hypothetical protein MMC18_001122 [Xylographa bjoerkii]|nr:hypothetical protein [Xylographa bjoerkii]